VKKYQYQIHTIELSDLKGLNKLSAIGWNVVTLVSHEPTGTRVKYLMRKVVSFR